jgi:hypothetical protein
MKQKTCIKCNYWKTRDGDEVGFCVKDPKNVELVTKFSTCDKWEKSCPVKRFS